MFRVGAVTEVHTDASKCGFGAILFQKDVDGKLHPVYYASKKTTLKFKEEKRLLLIYKYC